MLESSLFANIWRFLGHTRSCCTLSCDEHGIPPEGLYISLTMVRLIDISPDWCLRCQITYHAEPPLRAQHIPCPSYQNQPLDVFASPTDVWPLLASLNCAVRKTSISSSSVATRARASSRNFSCER